MSVSSDTVKQTRAEMSAMLDFKLAGRAKKQRGKYTSQYALLRVCRTRLAHLSEIFKNLKEVCML